MTLWALVLTIHKNKQGQFTMIDTVIEDVKLHGGGGGGAGVEFLQKFKQCNTAVLVM
jgi:hypothetical protein